MIGPVVAAVVAIVVASIAVWVMNREVGGRRVGTWFLIAVALFLAWTFRGVVL